MKLATINLDFDLKVFDYVIIGDGTPGLILAAVLTENPAMQVVVLEAGAKRLEVGQTWTRSQSPESC
jgi:choline dehydrogenase-like flavoprotein